MKTPDSLFLTGSAKCAGVIGWPISHSKSPLLHGYWLKHHKINGAYIPLAVEPIKLKEVLTGLKAANFRGINITIPHKVEVMSFADIISDSARRIGAANTLTFLENGKIHADNTDSIGFIENLKQYVPNYNFKNKSVLILGAGGAARAVVDALIQNGISELWITNRNYKKAEVLVKLFLLENKIQLKIIPWEDRDSLSCNIDLVVNTTSLGMTGYPDLDFNVKTLPSTAIVYDIVYTPLNTTLLKNASSCGLKTIDGLGMLFHQAAIGFKRWFDIQPVINEELKQIILNI